MNAPRELYLAACTEIAESLSPLGFKFARSGPRAQRTDGEFTYRVSFQSSHKNIPGHYVALWIHATVWSKRLGEWRASQAHTLGVGDGVAGGQIGNLLQAYGWRDWNLAVPTRPAVIADAISAVHSIALPYFAKFADLRSLCALLQREELPAMRSTEAIEFLLCFAERSAADAALRSFFHRRSDLVADYRTHLQQFREDCHSARCVAQGLPTSWPSLQSRMVSPHLMPPNRVGGRVAPPPPTPPDMRVRVRRFLAVLTDRAATLSLSR